VSVTGFLEPYSAPWYSDSTVKDTVLNLLVFLLVFLAVTVFLLTAYGISLMLVPGGKGLVFANPFAAALIPGLLVGLVAAMFRSIQRPGNFPATWALLAAAFLLLLTLPIPLIQQLPSVRASDASPLIPGRFLPLEDGSLLLSSGTSAILVPSDGGLMTVSAETHYDSLNQRFVFSSGNPKNLGSTGPERDYFQFTPTLASLQTDLLAVYQVLRDSSVQRPLVFWSQAWAITWLFLGLFFFFSLKTWPLVHIVLILLLVRLGILFLVYAFWSLPALVDLWVPPNLAEQVRTWGPVVLIDVAAATLFFMTWLSKPYWQAALR